MALVLNCAGAFLFVLICEYFHNVLYPIMYPIPYTPISSIKRPCRRFIYVRYNTIKRPCRRSWWRLYAVICDYRRMLSALLAYAIRYIIRLNGGHDQSICKAVCYPHLFPALYPLYSKP